MRHNMLHKFSLVAVATLCLSLATQSHAQTQKPEDCVQWKTYTDTMWVEQDVTENRVINETSYETKEVTKSRPRWVSEERERTITEEKPVTTTSERTVTRTVQKPVTTTKTRIKSRVIESFKDVTEMREETYTVRKPVVETIMRDEEVRVRRPVTRQIIKKEEVTVLRPKQSTETAVVPGTLVVPTQGASRPRPRWLRPGYYSDPFSGQPVWRRRGLHWVEEPQVGQSAIPVAIPQQRTTTTLVPETIVNEKPVEVTSFVDEFETRKVPVEVERMVEETRTRKVPVTVRIPKRRTIEEEIPYTETTYVDETITETVPYTETVLKKVTRKEPYTVMKESWQDYTETVRIPKTVSRRVPYVAKYRVPYLVEVRVPLDAAGRPVARGQQVAGSHRLHPAWKKMMTKVTEPREAVREVVETSVLEKNKADAAKFDVSGATDESAGKDLPPPPKVKFSGGYPPKSGVSNLKPIKRTIKVAPAPPQPEESEASKALAKSIEQRFINLGLKPAKEVAEESVETLETSRTEADSSPALDLENTAKVDFAPKSLSIEVEVPPIFTAPEPAAKKQDDDTIEHDVDLKRPDRS